MIKARGFVLTFLCLTCLLVIKSQIVSPNLCTKNINLRILVAMEKNCDYWRHRGDCPWKWHAFERWKRKFIALSLTIIEYKTEEVLRVIRKSF